MKLAIAPKNLHLREATKCPLCKGLSHSIVKIHCQVGTNIEVCANCWERIEPFYNRKVS